MQELLKWKSLNSSPLPHFNCSDSSQIIVGFWVSEVAWQGILQFGIA